MLGRRVAAVLHSPARGAHGPERLHARGAGQGADAEAAPIDAADAQASQANVVGEVCIMAPCTGYALHSLDMLVPPQVSADSEEPRTQLFATFESDVARVGKPAPVAHLVDRIQVLIRGLPASIQMALVL